MSLKQLLTVVVTALGLGVHAADSTFSKSGYQITLPGSWTDTSEPDLDAFASTARNREVTVTVMSARQRLEPQKLREVITGLLEHRAEAVRQMSGPSATFDGPIIGQTGAYMTGTLWGGDASGRQFGTTVFGDANGLKTFTFVGAGDKAAFRAEASKVFQSIRFK